MKMTNQILVLISVSIDQEQMGIINKKIKMNSKQKLHIHIIHKNPCNNFESKQFSNTLNKEIINIITERKYLLISD